MRKKRAYVVGFYGVENFGDDLFCEVIRAQAGTLFPGHDVRLAGMAPASSAGALLKALHKYRAAPGAIGGILRLVSGLWVVLRGDLVVLGGGSVLSELAGVRRVQWKLSRITRTRFEAVGVSLGPFADSDDLSAVSAFAADLERTILRDSRSLEAAESLGLHATLGGDLAALYTSPRQPSKRGPTKIGLALCNSDSLDPLRAARALANALLRISSHERPAVSVFALNNHVVHGDDRISEEAVGYLRGRGIDATYLRYVELGVAGVWAEIGSLDYMVAVRLHAAICAYLNEIPFVLVEYHLKCSDFCDDVDQDEQLRIGLGADVGGVEASISNLLSHGSLPRVPVADYKARAYKIYSKDGSIGG